MSDTPTILPMVPSDPAKVLEKAADKLCGGPERECHMRGLSRCRNEPHCTDAGECVLFLAIDAAKPKATKLRWPLVRITWVDSTGPRMWTRLTDVIDHHDMTVESVGWLIQDDADRIAIAAHVQPPNADNPMLDGVLTIPVVAIIKRVVLA